MPGPIDDNLLARRWLHSHEEDTPTEMVFRPDTYNFPPARGRTGFTLSAGGQAQTHSPGPTDRNVVAQGNWTKDASGRLTIRVPDAADHSMEILSVTPDRLVVKK